MEDLRFEWLLRSEMKYLQDVKLFVCLISSVAFPFIIKAENENPNNFLILLVTEVVLITYMFFRATKISSLSLSGDAVLAEINEKKYIYAGVYKVTLTYTYKGETFTKTLDVTESALGVGGYLSIKVNKNNPDDFLVLS